jgi:hypothetical protein
MKWLGPCALLVVVGCSVDVDYERRTLAFDPVSPPAPGGGAVPIAANGTTLFTGFISRDDGVTWAQANPAVIINTAQISNDGGMLVNTTAFGWGRWDKATDQINTINSPLSAIGHIHLRRSTGTIIAQQPGTTAIARQTSDGMWSQTTLPVPPSGASPPIPNFYDITSTADAAYLHSDWGIYRSADDGATWTYIYNPNNATIRLLPLTDGRLAVLSSARAIIEVIDAAGAQTGITSPQFLAGGGVGTPFACLGAIVFGDQYSTDLGQTFQKYTPDVPGITFELDGNPVCGGDYLLAYFRLPSPWLVKITTFGQLDHLYTYTPNYTTSTGSYTKLASGTVLAGNLAWKPGESKWSIRVLPSLPMIYALGDNSLYAVNGRQVYRSTDEGVTWTQTMAPADLPMWTDVFADADGTMWASWTNNTAGNVDMAFVQSKLYRSDDHGVTWTLVWDKMGMTTDGGITTTEVAPRLAAIASDGTFVGAAYRSGFYVSHDHGQTWRSSPFPQGFRFLMLTGNDHGVTFDENDITTDDPEVKTDSARSFHLWRDYGAGNAFAQVTPLVPTTMMGDQPADLSQVQMTFSIDRNSYVWWYGGMPVQGVWRSREPID